MIKIAPQINVEKLNYKINVVFGGKTNVQLQLHVI